MVTTPEILDESGGTVASRVAGLAGVRVHESTVSGDKSTPQPWSVKHMHRLIVTSATYRQSSKVTPELMQRTSIIGCWAGSPGSG